MTDLAFNAQDPCIPADRWIATLSDGTTVFQNDIPGKPTAWVRLQVYLEERGLHITNLRLQACGLNITLAPHDAVEGYWHSRRVTRLLAQVNAEDHFIGIGYVCQDKVHIMWIKIPDGQIKCEVRDRDDEQDARAIIPVHHDA